MADYTPDNWVVIKMTNLGKTFYKLLAGWSGGYLDGDSWRMNSGITGVEPDGDHLLFNGASGSVYRCHKDGYMLRMNNAHVWASLQQKFPDQVQLMADDTDWLSIEWGI